VVADYQPSDSPGSFEITAASAASLNSSVVIDRGSTESDTRVWWW
jgi:hypothetical protein